MRLIGVVFLLVGLPFFIVGVIWFDFAFEDLSGGQWEMLIGPAGFSFVGLLFAAIGGGVLIAQRRLQAKRELLVGTGRKVRAIITDIGLNHRISINNRHPYIIECQALVSGVNRVFKSSNIYGNVQLKKGDEVDVYLDFQNYDNYWVEISKE